MTSRGKKNQSKDPKRLQAFYTASTDHFERLYYLAMAMLHNQAEAEDAVQEVFTRAAEKIDQFEGRSDLYTWLVRILINLVKDGKRGGKRGPVALENEQLVTDPRENTQKKIEQSELMDRLMVRVNMLSPIFRDVVLLRYFDELSYQEISMALNISEGTVKSRLSTAKEQLKRYLLEDGFREEEIGI